MAAGEGTGGVSSWAQPGLSTPLPFGSFQPEQFCLLCFILEEIVQQLKGKL